MDGRRAFGGKRCRGWPVSHSGGGGRRPQTRERPAVGDVERRGPRPACHASSAWDSISASLTRKAEAGYPHDATSREHNNAGRPPGDVEELLGRSDAMRAAVRRHIAAQGASVAFVPLFELMSAGGTDRLGSLASKNSCDRVTGRTLSTVERVPCGSCGATTLA